MTFYKVLRRVLRERGTSLTQVRGRDDKVSRRILDEYGALFVADLSVVTPPLCIFESAHEVEKFQSSVETDFIEFEGAKIELQKAALAAFVKARDEAEANGLKISPRGGAESARRYFDDTIRLWKSRFEPALVHWQEQGRLNAEQVSKLQTLPLRKQVAAVLKLEEKGIFFSKDLSKSILYSVAAPGASQHLAMLALDVQEFYDEKVRAVLARHGWFRTVQSDLPHFTFLGREEKVLTNFGLKKVTDKDGEFWIPSLAD